MLRHTTLCTWREKLFRYLRESLGLHANRASWLLEPLASIPQVRGDILDKFTNSMALTPTTRAAFSSRSGARARACLPLCCFSWRGVGRILTVPGLDGDMHRAALRRETGADETPGTQESQGDGSARASNSDLAASIRKLDPCNEQEPRHTALRILGLRAKGRKT